MSQAALIVGDVFAGLASIPDGSVDLVLTSPPFLALRSYLPADHPDKALEIGSEATPAEYLDILLALTAEWRRVLAPHGSICIELGDTYSGSGGSGGDYNEGGLRDGQERFDGSASKVFGTGAAARPAGAGRGKRSQFEDPKYVGRSAQGSGGCGWPLAKSLTGIPTLYAWSLAYGRNLLTGAESPAGQWRIRNLIAWARPNPPVGALGDKFRPGTSYMTVACVSDRRYFDLDAVRTDPAEVKDQRVRSTNGLKNRVGDGAVVMTANYTERVPSNPTGPPPLDHWWHDDVFEQDAWLIPTQPYGGAHYATWPKALLERPIKAMCPTKVCRTCGEPSRRIVDTQRSAPGTSDEYDSATRHGGHWASSRPEVGTLRDTTGWTDCGHDDYRNGHVLDPFGGSGTTAEVSTGNGRDCTLIDLDSRNVALAEARIGMFLTDVRYLDTAREHAS